MSSQGSFNSKNPTIKRVLKEAAELSTVPTSDYAAAPLETNIFEWHFTLRGPPSPSPYADGLYHGRIVLPPSYPLRPPSFRFLTPSGRFEPNREICLSISGHHEESWQPAWGIRTALVAIRSFMDSEAKGQLGGIDTSPEIRARLARESRTWRCNGCGGKTNEEVMKERERAVELLDNKEVKEEKVPDELKLGYRDELSKTHTEASATQDITKATTATSINETNMNDNANATDTPRTPAPATIAAANTTNPTPEVGEVRTSPNHQPARPVTRRRQPQTITSWLDLAIGGVAAALIVMVLRRIAHYT